MKQSVLILILVGIVTYSLMYGQDILLNQFKDYWKSNRTDVIRDVAHSFTGRTLDKQ